MNYLIKSALVALAFCAGCVPYFRPSDAERTKSFEPMRNVQVDGLNLDSYLSRRTALIVNGVPLLGSATTAPTQFGYGVAVAIDRRGYFLTSAHLVKERFAYVVYFEETATGKYEERTSPARVVAAVTDEARAKYDFAIIHVDATLPCVMQWASASELAAGSTAVEIGCGETMHQAGGDVQIPFAAMAGKIGAVRNVAGGPTMIEEDLPSRHGDSGGPVATPDGKLIGIAYATQIRFLAPPYQITVRPDPEWVARVIADDIQKTPTTGPSTKSAPGTR